MFGQSLAFRPDFTLQAKSRSIVFSFLGQPDDIVVRRFRVVPHTHEAKAPHYEFVHIPSDVVVRPFKVVLAGHEAETLKSMSRLRYMGDTSSSLSL